METENTEYKNILFGRDGTFSIGYRVLLPEKYSLGEQDYDLLNEAWTRALRDLPDNTIFCKHDIFKKEKYNSSHFPERTYLEKATKEYFNGVEYTHHTCNIFYTLPNTLLESKYLTNPFRPPQSKYFKAFDEKINEFVKEVEQSIKLLNNFKINGVNVISIKPLEADYINNYYSFFSRGLGDTTQDIINEKKYLSIGDSYVGILKFPSEEKFPEKLRTCQVEKNSKNAKYSFFQNYGEAFGFDIPCTHIYCQIAILDEHKAHEKNARKNYILLNKTRKFDPSNKLYAEELNKMLTTMAKNETERIIRAHNSIIIFGDSLKDLENGKTEVKDVFKTLDIRPEEPRGNSLLANYEYMYPLNNQRLVERQLYIASLNMFSCFINLSGEYRDDPTGTIFNSRLDNTPVTIDLWDEKKKYVRARNFFILSPTGGGKSVLANHIITHNYAEGYKTVIVDLGGSYEKITALFPKEDTTYITYKEGKGLGINPFYIEEGTEATTEKLEQLADFIGVHYQQEREINQQERTAILRILKLYYENIKNDHSLPNFIDIVAREKENIKETLEISDDFFNMDDFVLRMREFGENGVYSFLYENVDNSFSANTKSKKIIVFELDKIKKNKLLLSVMLQLIATTIDTVVWEDKKTKGTILFDEVAEQFHWDGMLRRIGYIFQAVRKQNGNVGIILQSVAQLPHSEISDAIVENTQIIYVLDSKDFKAIQTRFNLSDHAYYQMTSLSSDLSSENNRPYSEVFIMRGKHHQIYRLELPKKVWWAYQTEGADNERLMDYYRETGNMEEAINKIMKE